MDDASGRCLPFAAGNEDAKFAIAPALMGVSGLTANKPAGGWLVLIRRRGGRDRLTGFCAPTCDSVRYKCDWDPAQRSHGGD